MWIHQHNQLESSQSWHNSLQDFYSLTHPITQMTFDLHLNLLQAWCTQCITPINQIWDLSKLPFLSHCVYKVFTILPVDPKWPLTSTKSNRLLVLNRVHLHTKYEICPSFPSWDLCVYMVFTICPMLTPNDLWPPPKPIDFLYSMRYTYIPNMRSVQVSLLEISCLQGFNNLTPVDPKWPLTSTKNNRLLVLNKVHLHIKYEICPSFPFLRYRVYKVFTIWPLLTPKWPLPSTKNNRLLVLNKVHLHTKYEICPSFPSWDIVFTRFSQFYPCWPQMTFDLHQKQ